MRTCIVYVVAAMVLRLASGMELRAAAPDRDLVKLADVNRTIVTVYTKSGSFSFLPGDLERGPILVPEYGFFVARASDATSAATFRKELAANGLRTLRQQIRARPEQTWQGAMRAVHTEVNGDFPPYPQPAPFSVFGFRTRLRQKVRVEPFFP